MIRSKPLRRFGRARKGAAAIEFAIIAPLLMVPLLLGSIDLIDVLGVNGRAQNATASIADVVARDTSVSDDEVSGYWDALQVLMYPNDPDALDLRITSISIVDSSTAIVVWSEGRGVMPALQTGMPITGLDPRIMTPGSSLILAESSYHYDSALNWLFPDGATFRHKAFRRSRMVDPIERE
ncbi:MAG: pilus biosynthesis protein TadE [Alphaproteobacteria bacterium]|nr:MAG: pilus biosynthesis protein TadE [Alphaproteobacteria bacterium]